MRILWNTLGCLSAVDNYTFAKCVKLIKNRKELTDDYVEKLEEIVMDSAKAKAVIDASKMSMGMDISPVDLMNIEKFPKTDKMFPVTKI